MSRRNKTIKPPTEVDMMKSVLPDLRVEVEFMELTYRRKVLDKKLTTFAQRLKIRRAQKSAIRKRKQIEKHGKTSS